MRKFFNLALVAALFASWGVAARAQSTSYVIYASPSSLSFSLPAGSAAVSQNVFVNDTTSGPLPFALAVDQSWVTISATSSTTAGGGVTLKFGVNPAGLPAGSYTGHVILTASGVSNSPMAFPISLTVTSTSNTSPQITTQPASATVTAGKSATFSVAAAGASPMAYQWRKNGAMINGATSPSYTTPAETTSDNGAQFTVEVKNSLGKTRSQSAVLTVTSSTSSSNNYVIFANPTSLSLSVTAGGAAIAQNVFVNDTTSGPLPFTLSVDQPWVTTSATSSTTAGGGVMLLFGANPAGLKAGTYTGHVILTASGVSNSPMAFPITLTVAPAATAPAISTQPAGAKITAGQTATFNVAATGTAPLAYQWSMNGTAISGATSSSYTTPAETTAANNAQFTVQVSNSAGTATSSAAVLTVTNTVVAPAITTQPASQTIVSGNAATFGVAASGTGPLGYQWSMNGAAISGATSSTYTTPAETAANNNAKFTVTVSNSAGSVTSSAATLTVNTSTLVLNASSSALSFGSVNVSSSSSLNVTLTNAGNSTVTVSGVTVSGAGFTASGVSSGLMLNPGQTATLTATFAPSASGSVTGSVTVASNATNSPDSIALSGTGAAVVNHSVTLSWSPSTSTVIGYNTYSSTVSGGPYTKLTSSPDAATSYTDSGVQAGQTYYFVVTAVNSSNVESGYSPEVSAIVP